MIDDNISQCHQLMDGIISDKLGSILVQKENILECLFGCNTIALKHNKLISYVSKGVRTRQLKYCHYIKQHGNGKYEWKVRIPLAQTSSQNFETRQFSHPFLLLFYSNVSQFILISQHMWFWNFSWFTWHVLSRKIQVLSILGFFFFTDRKTSDVTSHDSICLNQIKLFKRQKIVSDTIVYTKS